MGKNCLGVLWGQVLVIGCQEDWNSRDTWQLMRQRATIIIFKHNFVVLEINIVDGREARGSRRRGREGEGEEGGIFPTFSSNMSQT